MIYPPTVIIRHRRENLKKCSLAGLEKEPNLRFYTYPQDLLPDLSNYILLKIGAPLLTEEDKDSGLLLIDGTWRLAQIIETQLTLQKPPLTQYVSRSLPPYRTAYPRRQTDCPDPNLGLSSVEALYIAHRILKRPHTTLFDFYYWKNEFFALNEILFT